MSALSSPAGRHRRTSLAVSLALPWLLTVVSASATPVYPGDLPAPGPDSPTLEDKRRYTMRLMSAGPLPQQTATAVPELTDPMALGHDTGLKIFDEPVQHLDLLAKPSMDGPDPADIELPPGSLRGIDILDDLEALFLPYDGRALDPSVLDVGNAEITEYRGVPQTTDGTPLNLLGFGRLIDNGRR